MLKSKKINIFIYDLEGSKPRQLDINNLPKVAAFEFTTF